MDEWSPLKWKWYLVFRNGYLDATCLYMCTEVPSEAQMRHDFQEWWMSNEAELKDRAARRGAKKRAQLWVKNSEAEVHDESGAYIPEATVMGIDIAKVAIGGFVTAAGFAVGRAASGSVLVGLVAGVLALAWLVRSGRMKQVEKVGSYGE